MPRSNTPKRDNQGQETVQAMLTRRLLAIWEQQEADRQAFNEGGLRCRVDHTGPYRIEKRAP